MLNPHWDKLPQRVNAGSHKEVLDDSMRKTVAEFDNNLFFWETLFNRYEAGCSPLRRGCTKTSTQTV